MHTSQAVAAYEIADSLIVFALGIIAVGEHLAFTEDKAAILAQFIAQTLGIGYTLIRCAIA